MVKRTLKNAINCVRKKVNKTPICRFYRKIKTGISLAESFFAADMLRVKLTGLWEISEGGVNNLPFFRLISKRVVVTDCAPQVQLCSVFTKRENIRKISGCATVFFTGEDCDKSRLSYSDYLTDIADLSLGFRLESEFDEATRGKVLRYPLWLLYNGRFYPKGNDKDKIAAFITELEQRKHSPKSEFCALIASHDRITPGVRTALHDAASSVAPVMCAGKFLHNDDRLKRDFKDNKIEYLKRFKFNICPENRSVAGYVTEKIFDSIAAGAIPIYYGGGGYLEEAVLNPSAILLYDGTNLPELTERIAFLHKNESAYRDFLAIPTFRESAVDFIHERNRLVIEKMEHALSLTAKRKRNAASNI